MEVKRNRSLDILKGILSIFIISLHHPFVDKYSGMLHYPWWIYMTVPAFFFISGYVSSLSSEKKGYNKIEDMYRVKDLLCRCLRFVIPFTIFFVFEQIVFRIFGIYKVGIVKYGLLALGFDWLNGGIGPGSYYFTIMIQYVFVFPLIFLCVKKKGFKGVLIVFAANFLFEVLKQSYSMNDVEYRLMVFRYIFAAAVGSYAFLGDPSKEKKSIKYPLLLTSFAVGGFFIYLFSYTSYKPKLITFWSGTSFLTVLFIVPFLLFFVRKVNIHFFPLEIIGKATFNIYLVQMVYYVFYDFFQKGRDDLSGYLISLAVCIGGGVLFWLGESKFTGWIIKKIKGKTFKESASKSK